MWGDTTAPGTSVLSDRLRPVRYLDPTPVPVAWTNSKLRMARICHWQPSMLRFGNMPAQMCSRNCEELDAVVIHKAISDKDLGRLMAGGGTVSEQVVCTLLR